LGEVTRLPKPESACFVIADISGYTSFLAGVELDHAQDIIADLMDTVVKGLRPPFRLAKFEGDAAFVYAVTAKVDGSMLQDTIESAYFKFRRRATSSRPRLASAKPALRWAISISSSSSITARW
jgi:class 3 adenylate cyclase